MNEWIIVEVPFYVYFGHFLGTFPIRPVSMIPWLLNWIIFWIESAKYFLNWMIFWIESWVKQYWIEYWINHFLAKFKYWIESDRVSKTPNLKAPLARLGPHRLPPWAPGNPWLSHWPPGAPLTSPVIICFCFEFKFNSNQEHFQHF